MIDGFTLSGGLLLQGTAQANLTDSTIINSGLGFRVSDSAKATFVNSTIIVNGGTGGGADRTGQVTFIGGTITINKGRGVLFLGQTQAMLKGVQITVKQGFAVDVDFDSRFTMDGGRIEGASTSCEIGVDGIVLDGSAQATLKNGVQLTNLRTSLALHRTSTATLDSANLSRNNAPCPGTVGIKSDASGGTLTLQNTDISGYTQAGISLTANGTFVVNGGTIRQNEIGIDIKAGNQNRPNVTITQAVITANQIGIQIGSSVFPSSRPKLLEKSIVTGNVTGIQVGRAVQKGCFLACFDLGTADDPGNNTFSGNTTTGVFVGLDAIVFATGNTWNPNTQAVGSTGRYTVGFLVTGNQSIPLIHRKELFLDGSGPTNSLTSIQF